MAAICEKYEHGKKWNPKPKKGLPTIPEYTMEDIWPMDYLGMDIFKLRGKSYLVIADAVSGYCLSAYQGNHTTLKEVLNVVTKLFLKMGITFNIPMHGGQSSMVPSRPYSGV